jgi:hypothetical protein
VALKGGDTWRGLDTLRVVDDATGEVVTDGCLIMDMDIDADAGRVTMTVSSDIG